MRGGKLGCGNGGSAQHLSRLRGGAGGHVSTSGWKASRKRRGCAAPHNPEHARQRLGTPRGRRRSRMAEGPDIWA